MWEKVVLPGDSSIQCGAYRVKHGSPTSDQYRFFHVEIGTQEPCINLKTQLE